MKKSLGMLLILLLLISFTGNCFAFPAPGKYECDPMKWFLTINKSNSNYYGTLKWYAKGGVISYDWEAPLSIAKNNEGRYSLELFMTNKKDIREFEEAPDGSLKMYVFQTGGGIRYVCTLNKFE